MTEAILKEAQLKIDKAIDIYKKLQWKLKYLLWY
jgi:hypothetical protein